MPHTRFSPGPLRGKRGTLLAAGVMCLWTGVLWAQNPQPRYLPHWHSLDQHQTPDWLQDAKVGLFVYPLHPTAAQYNDYKQRTGRLGQYNAQDSWDVTPWNPTALAKLAQQAGCKYLVFGVDPYSYFVTWPSRYADRKGSPFVHLHGPGSNKDYVAEIAQAVRGRGLRFGIYRNYLHPAQHAFFHETSYELIDRYQPDTLWLDGDKLSDSADALRSRELAAYYYNHSGNSRDVAIEDALGKYKTATWGTRLTHGDWYRKEMSPPHPNISDGYFVRYETLYRWRQRSPTGNSEGIVNNLVEWLIDSVAKNGNIEFAIHLGPAALYQLERRTLQQIGIWLEVNGEGIYQTRPWHAGVPAARTRGGIPVRYTTRKEHLYAFLFDWPASRRRRPESVVTRSSTVHFPHLVAAPETRVHMLGIEGELKWRQADSGIEVHLPEQTDPSGFSAEIPCDHAFGIRFTPAPIWSRKQPDWSSQLLAVTRVRGKVIDVKGPPNSKRDTDRKTNSAAAGEAVLQPRRGLPDGVYQTVRHNWITSQMPPTNLPTIADAIRSKYQKLILQHVSRIDLIKADVTHQTLVYPTDYYHNPHPVEVPLRRIVLHARDRFGDLRQLVCYLANYDKMGTDRPTVTLHINGHFGRNPSRLALGLEDRGGYSGAALGKLAIRGQPILTYDDHDIGESSNTPAPAKENGLYRTLTNLRIIDEALLQHFHAVDAVGLSGGCERLCHFLVFHKCRLRSAYVASRYNPVWTELDSRSRTGGPFGVNSDTDNSVFQSQFRWSELVLVGIARNVAIRFANNTYEGAVAKAGFVHELLPVLRRYTTQFTVGGDDPDADGQSNDGRNLSHEYDIADIESFVRKQTAGEQESSH